MTFINALRDFAQHRFPPGALRALAFVPGLARTPRPGHVRFGSLRRVTPVKRDFGFSRGGPIDRHYIEAFLHENRDDIAGRVLEIGDNSYTMRFGGDRVTDSEVLHGSEGNPAATFVGDLADPDLLPEAAYDCIVLTQTLHMIYDFRAALRHLERALKPGGVMLFTVPGISNIDPHEHVFRWYYSFTHLAVQRMLAEEMPACHVSMSSYGNVLTAISFLHGLTPADLKPKELAHHEVEYSIVHCARVSKRSA